LVSAEFVLNNTKPLSILLQTSGLDLCAACTEVRIVQEVLSEIRHSVDVRFTKIYNSAADLGRRAGVDASMPRLCSRQTLRANPNTSDMTPEMYYRTSVFIRFLDCMMQGLQDRFSTLHQDVAVASKLVLSVMLKKGHCSETELASLMQCFPDMPSVSCFASEYDRWWSKWQLDSTAGAQVCSFSDAMSSADPNLFPNIRTVLRVSAPRPSSTASNERCFSALKRLKTYLRSTMLQDRLSGLAMRHIRHDIPVPVNIIIDHFADLGPHRLAYLN